MTEEKTTQNVQTNNLTEGKMTAKKTIQKTASILLDGILCFWCTAFLCAVFLKCNKSLLVLTSGIITIIATSLLHALSNKSLGCWLFGTQKEELDNIDYMKMVIGSIIIILLAITFI